MCKYDLNAFAEVCKVIPNIHLTQVFYRQQLHYFKLLFFFYVLGAIQLLKHE